MFFCSPDGQRCAGSGRGAGATAEVSELWASRIAPEQPVFQGEVCKPREVETGCMLAAGGSGKGDGRVNQTSFRGSPASAAGSTDG